MSTSSSTGRPSASRRARRPKSSLRRIIVGGAFAPSKLGLLKARIWPCSRPPSLMRTQRLVGDEERVDLLVDLARREPSGLDDRRLADRPDRRDRTAAARGLTGSSMAARSSLSRRSGDLVKLTGTGVPAPTSTIRPATAVALPSRYVVSSAAVGRSGRTSCVDRGADRTVGAVGPGKRLTHQRVLHGRDDVRASAAR